MVFTLTIASCINLNLKPLPSHIRLHTLFVFGLLITFWFLILEPPTALALEPHPNLARRSDDVKTTIDHQGERVNLFNGNLNLSISIGSRYPFSENFGYQLKLHYNSNIWDLKSISSVNTAKPIKNSNAGLGWDLSLGRLIAPNAAENILATWVYVSPDGDVHPFFHSLHYDVDDSADNTYYTRDGTYYRLTFSSATLGSLEAADGSVRTFQYVNNEWRLIKLADRFTNYLTITYGANVWTLADNHGRVHTIFFKADSTGTYPAIIDRVVMAAFGGSSATYGFAYSAATVSCPSVDNDASTPATLTVPLLTNLTQPDGTQYIFSYHGSDKPAEWSGRAASMELPTKGKIEWTYQNYSFVIPGCTDPFAATFRSNVGVASRKLVSGVGVIGTWSYSPIVKAASSSSMCGQAGEMTNTVTTPLGDKTVYFFSVNTQGSGSGWNRSDYGLPFTKSQADSTGTRFLSREYYDCDQSGNNCQLVRSFYVQYEQDSGTDPLMREMTSVNRREVSQRTLYHDDLENGVARYADLNRSGFDGLGHFRTETTDGNFGAGDLHHIFRNYEAATGNYPSAGYAMPGPSSAWVLNTVSQVIITEGQSRNVKEYCFDRATGFLKRERIWKSNNLGGTAGANDVVIVNTPDVAGQIGKRQYYGGDTQTLGTGALCSLSLTSPQYEVRNTYQSGRISSAQFFDAAGAAVGSKLIDQTNDSNTGLAQTTRDGAGIATNYEYDAMGRLRWTKPEAGHGGWVENRYVNASASQNAKIVTYQYPNGTTTGPLTYNAKVYDGFERLFWEQRWMPGNTFPNRYTTYNALGWVTGKSEYSLEAPRYTEYLNYDPFGRHRIERPPDGAHHDVTYEYLGVRTERKTYQVGIHYNLTSGEVVEKAKAESTVYDRQGRTWQRISHPFNPTNPNKVTTYTFNLDGQMLQQVQDGKQVGSAFSYDGRGFKYLVQGTDGWNAYLSKFDPLGLAHQQRLDTVEMIFDYDRAGREVQVRELNNPSKVWREYVYGAANGTNDWRMGKVVSAKRYNHFPNSATMIVTETYTYGGKGGEVSQYEIEMTDGLHQPEKFRQTYSYNDLGEVEEIGYPESVASGSGNMGRSRVVRNSYSVGRLTAVGGTLNGTSESWATAIGYHPNGLVKQVDHANGVTDVTTLDASGLMRVGSFYTTGVKRLYPDRDDNFNSGDFQYDGAGILVRIGDTYLLRPEGYEPVPEPGSITPFTRRCQGSWVDPFGSVMATPGDSDCNPLVFFAYTASRRLVRVEDRKVGANKLTWTFYDLNGKLLTEYSVQNTSRQLISTYDYIYSDLVLLSDASTTLLNGARILHWHSITSAQGIRTDINGYKNNQ